MHSIQKRLLELSSKRDLSKMTLRETAIEIGAPEVSPSLLQYHFEKLEKLNLLFVDRKQQRQSRGDEHLEGPGTVSIPILGSANCGSASILATESPEGYIRISKNILKSSDGLIAVIASGSSMNNAAVNTPTKSIKAPINDGDIVVVDTKARDIADGYVLSIIDGMANIKKLMKRVYDIALVSESKDQDMYPPIIVSPEDDYMINGRIVMVCQP